MSHRAGAENWKAIQGHVENLHIALERALTRVGEALEEPQDYRKTVVSPTEVHFRLNWPILQFADDGTFLVRTLQQDSSDLRLEPWMNEQTPYTELSLRTFLLTDFLELTSRGLRYSESKAHRLEFIIHAVCSLVAASMGTEAEVRDITEFEPLAIFWIKGILGGQPFKIEIEVPTVQRAVRGFAWSLRDRIGEEFGRVHAAARR